jgi:hypothetical protein
MHAVSPEDPACNLLMQSNNHRQLMPRRCARPVHPLQHKALLRFQLAVTPLLPALHRPFAPPRERFLAARGSPVQRVRSACWVRQVESEASDACERALK